MKLEVKWLFAKPRRDGPVAEHSSASFGLRSKLTLRIRLSSPLSRLGSGRRRFTRPCIAPPTRRENALPPTAPYALRNPPIRASMPKKKHTTRDSVRRCRGRMGLAGVRDRMSSAKPTGVRPGRRSRQKAQLFEGRTTCHGWQGWGLAKPPMSRQGWHAQSNRMQPTQTYSRRPLDPSCPGSGEMPVNSYTWLK